MDLLLESALCEGVMIDLLFGDDRPIFGDVFEICGYSHPKFPASGKFHFSNLAGLGFEQVDDFFGITSDEEQGDDVAVWLYPLLDGEPVYHHSDPMSGVRLSYNILRNPVEKGEFFLQAVRKFVQELHASAVYRLRNLELGNPPDLSVVQSDMGQIVEYWREEGVEPGSSEALQIDY